MLKLEVQEGKISKYFNLPLQFYLYCKVGIFTFESHQLGDRNASCYSFYLLNILYQLKIHSYGFKVFFRMSDRVIFLLFSLRNMTSPLQILPLEPERFHSVLQVIEPVKCISTLDSHVNCDWLILIKLAAPNKVKKQIAFSETIPMSEFGYTSILVFFSIRVFSFLCLI